MVKITRNTLDNSADSSQSEAAYPSLNDGSFTPQTFIRHHIQLRALLLHTEAWFSARDIGRLMGVDINGKYVLKLDADQRQMMVLSGREDSLETLMLSESACTRCWSITTARKTTICGVG